MKHFLNFQAQHSAQLEEFNRLCREIDLEKGICLPVSVNNDASSIEESTARLTQQKLSFDGYRKAITQEQLDSYIVVSELLSLSYSFTI